MSRPRPLKAEALRAVCDAELFEFETTAELAELTDAIGQARALEALAFGVRIRQPGFNLFAVGSQGMGKHYVVRQFLEKEAVSRPAPSDWCFVYNFAVPHRPIALSLPHGKGREFKKALEILVEDAQANLAAAFESEEYRIRERVYGELLEQRQQQVIGELEEEASQANIGLLRSPGGLSLVPLDEGEAMSQEDFDALEEDEKQVLDEAMEHFRQALSGILESEPLWAREQRQKIKELRKEVASDAVMHLFDEFESSFEDLPEVVEHVASVLDDIVASAAPAEKGEGRSGEGSPYKINIFMEHDGECAPVVYEDMPSVYNLVGRVEHRPTAGGMMTDFTLIRCGALHRANGGYLIIDAVKLLEQPHAWDVLKRALRSGKIRTESVDKLLDRVTTVSLEPMPVALDTKVVLVGHRGVLGMLAEQDADFTELFKVVVDFDEDMPRTHDNVQLYARLVATLASKGGLRPLTPAAVTQVIEHAGRVTGDNQKLSIHISSISDLLREADHWAQVYGFETIRAEEINRSIDAKRHRGSRAQQRMQENTRRGMTLISTEGRVVGQVNGLSVLSTGHASFGKPARITATVRLGKGEVVDIEREVTLGGPLHSKGVFILTGFLGARFGAMTPLSLNASIVMEQSYSGVDGDSATCAEACALLSALSGLPITQGLAITGSMNQFGEVQAVGGVNEKIEGFFDLCKDRGLTGEQGVLIPEANCGSLMLRQDIVQASRERRFHIYPIKTVDEAICLLTDNPAGQLSAEGYPSQSVNALVSEKLEAMAERARQLRQRG